MYIALILPSVRVSSSLLFSLGGTAILFSRLSTKSLPAASRYTTFGPSNHAEPRVLVASCMPEPRCWRWSDSLWNENSIGKILPKKMCEFRKSFFLLARPTLHPMQKEQQRSSKKKLQLWNFRPPWSFANHCSDRKARSTFDPLVMQGQERADGRLSAADLYHLDTILLFSRNFLHASLWCQHNFLGSWFFRKVLTSLVDPVSLFKEASVWILSEVISPLYTIHPESREVSPSHKNRCAVSLW